MLDAPPRSARLTMLSRRLDGAVDPERAFVHLYASSPTGFWLDSAAGGERGRFSFVGDGEGPLGEAISCEDVTAGELRVRRRGRTEVLRHSIFEYLARESGRRQVEGGAELPFGFDCGFVGYLGYELKAECDGAAAHRSPAPDAAFVFADRLLAFDAEERCAHLLCLVEPGGEDEGRAWLEATAARLAALPALAPPAPGIAAPVEFRLERPRRRYLDDIAACKRALFAGETYEVCLTNKIAATLPGVDPLGLYRVLRRLNPAPFAAFLRFGELALLSSSPERFLRVDRERWAEARPIKGTAPRGESEAEDARLAAALRGDGKSRAENVTIVDLLRNDLGRVCEFGTVEATELMRVETYATVHQLVSVIRGRLRAGAGAVDCVRACFPPGSMTGAPKVRTMEIIDRLEGAARGPYAGAIGYFGLGGACDLSVAIRAIAVLGEEATIGIGGAIVLESDPEAEYREALLKGLAPMRAADPGADPAALGDSAPISSAHRPSTPREQWP